MIQAYSDQLLIVGVTRGNIEKLTAGQPMKFDILRPVGRVVVVFGEDKIAIIRALEAAGMEIPNVLKEEAFADPS